MAITIDWVNGIINVPRADMTLVQSTPIEIRELNLNNFRLELRDLEEDPDGRPWPRTHDHNTEFTTGGITFARVVEILEPYTITFENGSYLVNIIGGNSNLADRTNPNNVGLRANNSAGLITSKEIELASFNGGVTIDKTNGVSGTLYPIGSTSLSSNNVPDSNLIGDFRGLKTFYVIGDIDFVSGDDIQSKLIIGENASRTTINILDAALTDNCEIREATVTGDLDNGIIIRNCMVFDLKYVDGVIYNTMINPGTILLGSNATGHFIDCSSGQPGTDTPIIDLGGSGQALAMRGYKGGITLINKTGIDNVSIDLSSGQVKLDLTTVTNGTIVVRGDGKVIDVSNGDLLSSGTYGSLILVNETTPSAWEIAEEVWNHIKALTFGKWFSLKKK